MRHAGSLALRLCCCALLMVATAAPAALAQSVSGTILGTVTDSSGAIVAGAKVTIVNEGTALTRTVISDANGEYTAPSLPTGHYTVMTRDDRLQDARALEHRGRRRPARAHQSQARSRRDDRVGQRHRPRRRWSRPPRPSSGTTVGSDADRGAAAQRPQLRQPDPHHPRRPARHSWREHRRRRQPGLARLRVVLRQRPAPARQQLHARRRRQQRDLAADGRHLPERRCARRVQDADLHLLGGVRPLARRRRQPADQVRHQPAARQRLRVPPQRRASTPTTSSTTARTAPSRTSSRTSSAARSAARCSRTRRSSSATTRATARRRARRPSRRCRRWRCGAATSPS